MPVMPVMSLSNLSPGCFPTRLSFALTGIASAVGTQGGKGLDLKGAKAGTAKLQLAATGCNHQNAGTSFHQFSVFFFYLSTCWYRISGVAGNWSPASSNGRALETRMVFSHLPAGPAESSKLRQALRNHQPVLEFFQDDAKIKAERRKDWAT